MDAVSCPGMGIARTILLTFTRELLYFAEVKLDDWKMAKIIVKRREGDQAIALTAVETVIGRASSCTMPLKDGTLSRNHCKITLTSQGFIVSDMGSRNGTTVNGTVVKEKKLEPGDRIDIGNSVLVFESEIPGRDYGPRKDDPAPQNATKAVPAADTVLRRRPRKEETTGDFASWTASSEGAPGWLAPAVLVAAVCALVAFVIFRSKTSVAPAAPKGDAVETADFEGTRTPEGLPEGWVKGNPTGVVRVVEGVCRSGKASLRIEKSEPKELVSTCVRQSRTRVPAGSVVELTGSVRAEGVSGACGLRLALYRTETDTVPASEKYGLVPTVLEPGRSTAFTSEWQELIVGAAAEEDMFAEFGCVCVGFAGAANFDDLALFIRAGA
jgi:hypothetical protein